MVECVENKKQKWDANGYHKHSSIQHKAANELLSEINFNGNESILDIGCGDGKITASLLNFVPNGSVLGVDLSPEMIQFAAEKFLKLGINNISFKQCDARALDYDNKFDILFSSFALHWVIDFNGFMSKAAKALKPGGKIVFTIPLGISAPLEQASEEVMSRSKWAKYFVDYKEPWQFSPQSEYKAMISEAGFEVNKCDVINHRKIFDSKSDYMDYIVQWYPYPHQVEASERSEFFEEVCARSLELEEVYSDGRVNFEFPQIDIIAYKK